MTEKPSSKFIVRQCLTQDFQSEITYYFGRHYALHSWQLDANAIVAVYVKIQGGGHSPDALPLHDLGMKSKFVTPEIVRARYDGTGPMGHRSGYGEIERDPAGRERTNSTEPSPKKDDRR